ncbi:MAG TPA: iron-sulfur cluster assembly accessory protein [Thiotrichales bacterium]|nr:iron-sulfur cluster assembly accessory protein [Thiotrichales bacterium]
MFAITQAAAEQIRAAIEQEENKELLLRVAAKVTEDGSIEYGMGLDEPKEDDTRLQQYDVEILIDPKSVDLLDEATMDYVELEPGQFRFIFLNPMDPHYVPPKKD